MGRLKKTALLGSALLFLIFSWTDSAPCSVFTDALGRSVRLDAPPQRIVSLAPSLTEILFSLGLGERVVGVTRFSSYPPEASRKPKVGSYINLNVEKIISLAPDLVIGTVDGNARDAVELLEKAGIRVFLVNPRNLGQVIQSVAILGRLCGVPGRGEHLSRRLWSRVSSVQEKVGSRRRPRVFLQINIRPIMTVNRNTYHNDLIRLAGGINITRDERANYPRISIEEVIRRKPEVILISSMERGGRFEEARRDWMAWRSIPAVRKGRVCLIESDLIDRPSPRIVAGLERMARIIHPEADWN
ncbi:MAG: cobalamin-binding protein [Deltaproteobacteria bacterium]|nr:cobalamin-binding protein [Deltaproteobacteria bacterium]MBW2016337.1 cobalamin-binding protein [Deltaproteobacteria bacterium]MBW2129615.1 cobalamin-binding protein [Deltaproteobacteria bacterium]MBW2304012.1 cobalamin-binding protein [Deltaproteobacteria bacterium]